MKDPCGHHVDPPDIEGGAAGGSMNRPIERDRGGLEGWLVACTETQEYGNPYRQLRQTLSHDRILTIN